MIPTKLSVRNFMCYRDNTSSLVLEGIQIACICGDNGHGKSALLDAMTWALWGKARAKSSDELIHLGQTDMEVEMEFIARDDRYRVIRKHSKGKPGRGGQTILELHAAVGPPSSGFRAITANTVRETQRQIIDLLRMDYDTFVNSAFLRQGRADEFTVRTPRERKGVLADILGLSLYDELEAKARKSARGLETEIAALEMAIADIDRQMEQRSAQEAEQAQVIARLAEIDRDEASQRALVQEQGRRKDLLEVKKEEMERIEKRSKQAGHDLQQVQRETEGHRESSQEYDRTLAQRVSVEEGYKQLQETLRQKEEMDRKLARSNALVERRGRLETEMETEKGRLATRREGLNTRAQYLRSKSENLDGWEEELAEVSLNLARLDELEAEMRERWEKAQEISARAHHLKTVNDQLMQEMQELKGKVNILAKGEAQCPLCGTTIGEDGLNHIQRAYEQQGQEKKKSYLENQKLMEQSNTEYIATQQDLRHQESELNAQKRERQGRISVLERDVAEGKLAGEESETVRRELEELDAQISAGNFAIALRQELAQVTSELEELRYDTRAHQEARQSLESLQSYNELYQKLQEAERRLPEVQQALQRTEAREARLNAELEEDSHRRNAIASELVDLPRLQREVEVTQEAHALLLEDQRRWRDRPGNATGEPKTAPGDAGSRKVQGGYP